MGASGRTVVNIDTLYLQIHRQNPLTVKTYFKNATSNFNEFSMQYVFISPYRVLRICGFFDFVTSATKSPNRISESADNEVCTICCMFFMIKFFIFMKYCIKIYSQYSKHTIIHCVFIKKNYVWTRQASYIFKASGLPI
jgi:hypothetical protein